MEILPMLASLRGPSAVQLLTMEPGSGPGGQRGPAAPEDCREGGGDLCRQLLELVSAGNKKSWQYTPLAVDYDQQACGPWLTPDHVVKPAVVVFFVQPSSGEFLNDRRSALC